MWRLGEEGNWQASHITQKLPKNRVPGVDAGRISSDIFMAARHSAYPRLSCPPISVLRRGSRLSVCIYVSVSVYACLCVCLGRDEYVWNGDMWVCDAGKRM